jgi:peptidoglycan-associated lipoprotein
MKNKIATIITLSILLSSCKTIVDTKPVESNKAPEKVIISAKETTLSKVDKVFFQFDSSSLDKNAKKNLNLQAAWIKNNSPQSILIQGHCDERGSRSYNMILGKKRALAVKKFLVSEGVKSKIINIVSYGEDRPVTRGKGEKVWSQNRRAVTIEVN